MLTSLIPKEGSVSGALLLYANSPKPAPNINWYLVKSTLPPAVHYLLILCAISLSISMIKNCTQLKDEKLNATNFKKNIISEALLTPALALLLTLLILPFKNHAYTHYGVFYESLSCAVLILIIRYIRYDFQKGKGALIKLISVTIKTAPTLFLTFFILMMFSLSLEIAEAIIYITLFIIVVIPILAIRSYRKESPIFKQNIPYKFCSTCIFLSATCLLIPLFDNLGAFKW